MRRNEEMLLRKYQFNSDSFPTRKIDSFTILFYTPLSSITILHVRRAKGYSSAAYRSETSGLKHCMARIASAFTISHTPCYCLLIIADRFYT